MIEKCVKLQADNAKATEKMEALEEKVNKSRNRNSSLGSDGDYNSVAEMKDHMKHARQILIQFIQKLPYS